MVVAMLPTGATASTDGCRDPYTPIYDFQGDGDESPLHDFPQIIVTTEGIVTVDKQTSGELSGFFIQDPRGDGDPATSDGIVRQRPRHMGTRRQRRRLRACDRRGR